jgi:acyl carrier protein
VDAETTLDPRKVITEAIETLLARRGASGLAIGPESKLTADLGMDSLELAELSAVLEDELGHDPYSEGIVPETVAELVGYYES